MCLITRSTHRGRALSILSIKVGGLYKVVDINGHHPSCFPRSILESAEKRSNAVMNTDKAPTVIPTVRDNLLSAVELHFSRSNGNGNKKNVADVELIW